ncbi:hypothetical protein D3C78_1462730 [compost metagenome]
MRPPPGRKSKKSAQTDPWKEISRSNSDLGCTRSQTPFGCTDIGPSTKQVSWFADREPRGYCRQGLRRQILDDLIWTHTQQRGDSMPGSCRLGLKPRDLSLRGLETGLRSQYIQFSAHPNLPALFGQVE